MFRSRLGYQALAAIVLGIFAGLFFGPYCDVLKPIGDVFIVILQIVVIPYIPALLMHGLGSLPAEMAKKLFRSGWPILVLLWILILVVSYIVRAVIPTTLPNPASDFSFDSSALFPSKVAPSPTSSFFGLFHNTVPGIALFGLFFGLAIMHLKEKEPLLGFLERVNNAFDRLIRWISFVAPIAIFSHIAYVMGTINFDDLPKLQLYIGMVIGTTLFLSLWVLPALVSCLTSIPIKEIFREFRMVAFLPFATGIPTLALPYINHMMKRLAERKNLSIATFQSTSQTIIPIGFGFAQIGNFIPLLFIFFLSFYYRHPFTGLEAFSLPFLITLFSVGTPQFTFVALPFLLRILNLPDEGFNLYAEISSITLNFQVLLSTISMLAFMILVVLKYYGLLEIQWKRLMLHASCTAAVLITVAVIGKSHIHTPDNYHNLYYNLNMGKAIVHPPQVTVFTKRPPPSSTHIENTLARILDRGILRVGYDTRNIPFCYLNQNSEVVGYDIAYAYQLAKDLDVKLELVPIEISSLASDLDSGFYDIAMSAILMDETRILHLQFSNAYIEQPNVIVVPLAEADLFTNLSQINDNPQIKIGAVGGYKQVVTTHFPKKEVTPCHGETDLLSGAINAYMWAELPAYIWCLAHPEYTVISFHHALGKQYFGYPCSANTEQFIHFINDWLKLKQEQGFQFEQRQYWFLGKAETVQNERWSIIRNVLHWVGD